MKFGRVIGCLQVILHRILGHDNSYAALHTNLRDYDVIAF